MRCFKRTMAGFLAFAAIFSIRAVMAAEENQSETEPVSISAYEEVADDIRQNGVCIDDGWYFWHIQRIDDLDETEYDLELKEDSGTGCSTISCSHNADRKTYTLTIPSALCSRYAVSVSDTNTMALLGSGTIEAESYTGDNDITDWASEADNSSELLELTQGETTLLVQLLQAHTVHLDNRLSISDFGFNQFEKCEIHAPGLRLVTKMPTCTKSGLCEYDCQICGTHIEEVLPHFRPEDQLDEDHIWKYDELIQVIGEPHESTANYHCAACGSEKERPFCAKYIFWDMPPSTKYSHVPIDWAYLHGITKGTSSNTFSPNGRCTRAEIITQLWRAAGSPEPSMTESPFTDVKASSYYGPAVLWAYENQITTGISKTKFGPRYVCTRAQIITFIWKAKHSPEAELQEEQFDDVGPEQYYYNALLWALENNITSGTTETTFSPGKACTRQQVATFLYKSFS